MPALFQGLPGDGPQEQPKRRTVFADLPDSIPELDPLAVEKAAMDRRNLNFATRAPLDAIQMKLLESVNQQQFGESAPLSQPMLDLMARDRQVTEQLAGGPEAPPAPAVDRGGRDFPSTAMAVLGTGLRPWGAALDEYARRAEANAMASMPGASEEQIRKAVVDAAYSPWYALSHPADSAASALRGVKSIADFNEPTVIDAVPAFVERYGETSVQPNPVLEPALNAGRAVGDMAGRAADILTVPASAAGTALAGAWNGDWQSVRGIPQAAVETVRDAVSRTIPPSPPSSEKSIVGPAGIPISKGQATDLAFAASFVPGADLTPGLAAAGTQAVGGAARAVKAAAPAVAATLPAAVTSGVAAAAEKIADATRPTIEGLGKTFGGMPYRAKLIARQAVAAGKPASAEDIARGIAQVPFKQAQMQRVIADLEKVMHGVPESEIGDFFNALEKSGRPAKAALKRLSPESKKAVDAYRLVAENHGVALEQLAGLQLRENYAAHPLTKASVEARRKAKAIVPPGSPENVVPAPGGHFKQRTVPELLTKESRRKVVTAPEVNEAIRTGTGPIATGLRESGVVVETNPAKNFADRFVRSANEIPWAKTIKEHLGPLVSAPGTPGYSQVPRHTLAARVLGEEAWLPREAVAILDGTAEARGPLSKLWSAAMAPWKAAVTALGGPGYHFRNEIYSKGKLLQRFRGNAPAIESHLQNIRSGAAGEINGIAYDEIRKAAKDAGTWEGTGGGPNAIIGDIRRSAGLERSIVPGAARKAYRSVTGFATRTDEDNRMAAIIGRLMENPGGGLTKAIDWANRFIVRTDAPSPAMHAAKQAFPFITWSAREVPNAIKEYATTGTGVLPAQVLAWKNAQAPSETKLPEDWVPRRAREQASYPIGKKTKAGAPIYASQSWSVMGPMTQVVDPLFQAQLVASGKKGLGNATADAASSLLSQAAPPLTVVAQGALGQDPLTKRPLESYVKAPAAAMVFARHFPGMAKQMFGMEQDENGTWHAPAGVARFLQSIPYAPYSRLANAKTDEDRRMALYSILGLSEFKIDPTVVRRGKELDIKQRAEDERAKLSKLRPNIARVEREMERRTKR